MKLAIASLLLGSAAAFAPGATFNARNTALNMATETADKVRYMLLMTTGDVHNKEDALGTGNRTLSYIETT